MPIRKCPTGSIRKVSYRRKGYRRRSYRRKNGTLVKAASVGPSRVGSICIRDIGKPGKGPKLFRVKKGNLPGYSVKDAAVKRRAALRRIILGTSKKLAASHSIRGKRFMRQLSARTRVILRLNALNVYWKNQPNMAVYRKRVLSDMKYVRSLRRSAL